MVTTNTKDKETMEYYLYTDAMADDAMNTRMLSGVFFHGKLEADAGLDLVHKYADGSTGDLSEGVHAVRVTHRTGEKDTQKITTKNAIAFIWKRFGPAADYNGGLVVYGDDLEAVRHAALQFAEQAQGI